MNPEEQDLSGMAGHLEWLGRNDEPTILSELLNLLLTPMGYVGLVTGTALVMLMKWNKERRARAARQSVIDGVARGRDVN